MCQYWKIPSSTSCIAVSLCVWHSANMVTVNWLSLAFIKLKVKFTVKHLWLWSMISGFGDCRNAMECRLCQKASGCAVAVSSRHHVLSTVVFVQIEEVHSSRRATAAGRMLRARCGFQKWDLRTTYFLNRSTDWSEFRQLADAWRAASVGAVVPELASSAIGPTATPHFTSRVHRWPVSTWRWHP